MTAKEKALTKKLAQTRTQLRRARGRIVEREPLWHGLDPKNLSVSAEVQLSKLALTILILTGSPEAARDILFQAVNESMIGMIGLNQFIIKTPFGPWSKKLI